mgnify:CR=1 FL=1
MAALAGVSLVRERLRSTEPLLLPRPSALALTASTLLLADAVVGFLLGSHPGGDAGFHVARIRWLITEGFNGIDPLVPFGRERVYQANLYHALIASAADLFGASAWQSWFHVWPWAKLVSAGAAGHLAWTCFGRRWIAWIAAVTAAAWNATYSVVPYPNTLSVMWLLPLAAAFCVQACVEDERQRVLTAAVGLAVTSLVLAQAHPHRRDGLHRALALRAPEHPLGDDRTKEFLVREVFEIAPEQIRNPAELLRLLLRRHYRGQRLPPVLDAWIIAQLEKTKRFTSWPLERLLSNREDFLTFLQERWPLFVTKPKVTGTGVAEPTEPYGLRVPGPVDLPFDHEDVRVYIDSLFLDGLLAPTSALPKKAVEGTWLSVGVRGDDVEDASLRFERLTDALEKSLPTDADGYRSWTDTAWRCAEWSALRWTLGARAPEPKAATITALAKRVDETFTRWMLAHYASLQNVSYLPLPVMVHQVPRHLAHGWVSASRGGPASKRLALLVMDGLALSQWTLLRAQLTDRKHRVSEHAIFAWVPTLTSVSRQSIFAGEPPFYFSASLNTTAKEESHWRRFWEDRDASRAEVAYVCQKSQEPDAALIERVK